MENSILIEPRSEEISIVARALKIKNEFLALGFTRPYAFVELVCDIFPKYSNPEGIKNLNHWWAIRKKDEALNADLEIVLEKLRHE